MKQRMFEVLVWTKNVCAVIAVVIAMMLIPITGLEEEDGAAVWIGAVLVF